VVTACGIDMGSNSFRLLVAELEDGRLRPLACELVTVRLGEGLGKSGLLAPAAMARAETALAGFAARVAAFSPGSLRVCATHAVRRAANQKDFLAGVRSRTGFTVEVLSGEEEASLALRGVFFALPPEQRRYPFLLADVGGGSSEIIRQNTFSSPPRSVSLPLGAVGLTEEFGSDPEAIRRRVRALLNQALEPEANLSEPGSFLVVSGGTATSLAALSLGLVSYEARLVQNYLLTDTELGRLVNRLASLSRDQREALPGMGQGRGGIILAGAVILQELQRTLAGQPLLVSDAGLLEGILLSGERQASCPQRV